MITKKSIEDVKFAARIEEVVGEHLTLKRQGSSFVCICPFHNDKNPSMHVNPKLGIYKCFVCGAAGDSLKFLMEYTKMTYPEAIEALADKYNIVLEHEKQTEEFKQQNTLRDRLYAVNEFARDYFREQLRKTEEGKLVGMAYFQQKRQFKEITIDKFQLGYCPENWDGFTKAALAKGFKEEDLISLGLTKKTDSGKLFDFYRGRVIFPIRNQTGKVIGFGGRTLKQDKQIAKYFNSPESEIYHKSDTLYDIYLAKQSIRKENNLYLVEGYTDVISMHEAGISNVVASSGTSLTPGQVKIISALTKNVTVLYDGDAAGIHAALRGTDMLLSQGLNVRVCLLPDGEDPDSFAKNHRDSELKEYLDSHAEDLILFKAKVLFKEAGDDISKRANVINDALDNILNLANPVLQQEYIRVCAGIFGYKEEFLSEQLRGRMRDLLVKATNEKEQMTMHGHSQLERQPSLPQIKPATAVDLRYVAEKNIIMMLLKYGLFEIRKISSFDSSLIEHVRVDQYVFDELYNDCIIIKDPLLRKIYNHYASIVEVLRDQTDIQRCFLFSEDQEEVDFALQNIEANPIGYSSQWEKKFDMFTHFADNNIVNLQQEVQNNILSLKLRVLEDHISFLKKEITARDEMGQLVYSEDDVMSILGQISEYNKYRKEVATRLNRVVSR